MKVDTWDYEIICSKHYLVEKWEAQYGRTFQAGYNHQRERERERERQTDRQTDRQTEIRTLLV